MVGGGAAGREGESGGGVTGTEAGIAMGGVGVVVEHQSIDIIEQRRPPHDPRERWVACSCWLAAGLLLPTHSNPLNGAADTTGPSPLLY